MIFRKIIKWILKKIFRKKFVHFLHIGKTGGVAVQRHAYFTNGIHQTLAALSFRVESQFERGQQRVPVQHFEKIARVDQLFC